MKIPKVIYNNWIPFSGFALMNFFGVIFIKNGRELRDWRINHELIHTAQMKELGYVLYYVLYPLEFIYRLFQYKFKAYPAYRNISFEREAYYNQRDFKYLDNRKKYNVKRYISLSNLHESEKVYENEVLGILEECEAEYMDMRITLMHTSDRYVQIVCSSGRIANVALQVYCIDDIFSPKWDYEYKKDVLNMIYNYGEKLNVPQKFG